MKWQLRKGSIGAGTHVAVAAIAVIILSACGGEGLKSLGRPLLESAPSALVEEGSANGQTELSALDQLATDLRAQTPSGRVRIGILLPLSGPQGATGRALLHAAEQALFDVGDPWIEILPRDTKGTALGAKAAMKDALSAGAEIILGPLLSTSVREAAPLAKLQNVNVIAFSTDRSVAGGNVFLIGFSPEDEVRRIIQFARDQGLRRFAALVPQTPYGDRVADALRLATGGRFQDLVRITTYPPLTSDIYNPVRELADYDQRHRALLEMRRIVGALDGDEAAFLLKELEEKDTIGPVSFDAVMIAEGGAMLEALAPLLPFYDIDPKLVRFLGTGLWDDPGTLMEPSLEGGWFTGPHPLKGKAFFEQFKATFGYEPPRISSLAYDAMTLVVALQYAHRPDPYSRDALLDRRGFKGTDGAFRFSPDGTAERNLAIMEVGARDFRVIDESPDIFEAHDIFEAPSIAAARPPGRSLARPGSRPQSRSTEAARQVQRRDDLQRRQ